MSEDRYGAAGRPEAELFRPGYRSGTAAVALSDTQGLVIAGWVLAFLIPFIGFIIGIILTAKNRTGHGVGIMVVSLIFSLFIVALIASMPK